MTVAIVVADSVTTLGTDARGAVLVSGSHGGLVAAQYASAAGVRGAIFNDAGRGLDDAGIAGVRALDAVGLAAATVAHTSSRIADGGDTLARGVVSYANAHAAALGVAPGMRRSRGPRRKRARRGWRRSAPISWRRPSASSRRRALRGPSRRRDDRRDRRRG